MISCVFILAVVNILISLMIFWNLQNVRSHQIKSLTEQLKRGTDSLENAIDKDKQTKG